MTKAQYSYPALAIVFVALNFLACSGNDRASSVDARRPTPLRDGGVRSIADARAQDASETTDATIPKLTDAQILDAGPIADSGVPLNLDAESGPADMFVPPQDSMDAFGSAPDVGVADASSNARPDVSICEPDAMRRCVDGVPHWFDSCGGIGRPIEMCAAEQICENGLCVCNPNAPPRAGCDGANVVLRDGCGLVVNIVEMCGPTKICTDARCLVPNCQVADEICDGNDNDCDGTVDEEVVCPAGLSCANGRCGQPGTQCHECVLDEDCADGYICGVYQNFPELGGVCAKTGCANDADCPDGFPCDANGICWMQWQDQCLGENPWNIDSCGRQVRQIEECNPARPCENGRCVGAGQLCGECEGDGDCANGFRCRGYANFPELPQICVPESDCNVNPQSECPDGLQCSPTGICWMDFRIECRDDGDRWAVDTCNRTLTKVEDCPQNSVCREDRCVGAGELCAQCQADGDCALGYVCRGYANFPDIPNVCVPESDCATNPNSQCPNQMVCDPSGVCWLSTRPVCEGDDAVWQLDTCGRQVFMSEVCGLQSVCQGGQCIGSPIAGVPFGGAASGGSAPGGQAEGGGLVGGLPSLGGTSVGGGPVGGGPVGGGPVGGGR